MDREISQERAVVHVLHYDQERILAHSIDLYDVLMLEFLHNLSFAEKILELSIRLNRLESFDGNRLFVLESFHASSVNATIVSLIKSEYLF